MILNYKKQTFIVGFFIAVFFTGCGSYSFTGASIPEGTQTFQVNFFENDAGNTMGSIFEPGLDRDFTLSLQNILQNQTNLQLVSIDGDLIYEGEITEYRVSPMTATSDLTASQNRLSIRGRAWIGAEQAERSFAVAAARLLWWLGLSVVEQ